MSPELKNFLNEWYDWATAKLVEDSKFFKKSEGLCVSLNTWCNWNAPDKSVELIVELITLLERDFKDNYQFPFDKNLSNYWQAKSKGTHYKNPRRVQWVKKLIGQKC